MLIIRATDPLLLLEACQRGFKSAQACGLDPDTLVVVSRKDYDKNPWWARLEEEIRFFVTEDDWLWVTDENWDGDLSAVVRVGD